MTEEQKTRMSSEELAIELMTSGQRLSGGRAEALRLIKELRVQWGGEIANLQRTAHDTNRPYFHGGLECRSEFDCHVSRIIDLAEMESGPAKAGLL